MADVRGNGMTMAGVTHGTRLLMLDPAATLEEEPPARLFENSQHP